MPITISHNPQELLVDCGTKFAARSNGPVKSEWIEAARQKGFTFVCRVHDHQNIALECGVCGGVHSTRIFTLTAAKPQCPHCLESARHKTAEAANLIYLRRDPDYHKCAIYRAACGHEARRQFEFIERVAAGMVALRCKTCLVAREDKEARRFGWSRSGPDPQKNVSYRLYQHHCGHLQRIAVGNMRWGQCDCAQCGQSWASKPSFIYLLDIRHSASQRHFLKFGYSATPVKRHRHQLGFPADVKVKVLRVVAMRTGHNACSVEKAAHAEFRRTYPEAIVPHHEYAELMNVVSEIYRPWFETTLQQVLDRIEAEVFLQTSLASLDPNPQ